MLVDGNQVPDFHLEDALLCYMVHLFVPSRECAKMIWEEHHSRVAGHFGVEKIVVVLQNYFYWPKLLLDVGKYIRPCITYSITKPTI